VRTRQLKSGWNSLMALSFVSRPSRGIGSVILLFIMSKLTASSTHAKKEMKAE
jgi:hypothetical protein